MKYSDIALKVLAAKECGIFKTRSQFWELISNVEKFNSLVLFNKEVLEFSDILSSKLKSMNSEEEMICIFDSKFPFINRKVRNNGDKPYLLFSKGDLSLLKDLNKNIAIIGLTDPDNAIIKREREIVRRLVKNDFTIISGLAIGCDSVAHKTCIEEKGKTIAILPSQIGKIYPAENRDFAEEIVQNGGLIISEYYKDANSKNEAINRFIERDRLQAMFSKAIVLIASYRKGEGDSGSRHAFEAAKKYAIERFVMYNDIVDEDNLQFGLNKDYANKISSELVKILIPSSINYLKSLKNPYLYSDDTSTDFEQLMLL